MENRAAVGTPVVSPRIISGKGRDRKGEAQDLLQLLEVKLPGSILSSNVDRDEAVVRIDRSSLLDFYRLLKLDSELRFDFLVSITAVDWLDQKEQRFEVVYHVMSLANAHRLRVKVWVPEDDPQVESVTALWSGANFMEREVWDMYGITFKHHPDLRRILMYDEFEGHPLRKDYPVQGKQPRIPLRSPEVHNTARDMHRPDLVTIRPRSKTSPAGGVATNGSSSHG